MPINSKYGLYLFLFQSIALFNSSGILDSNISLETLPKTSSSKVCYQYLMNFAPVFLFFGISLNEVLVANCKVIHLNSLWDPSNFFLPNFNVQLPKEKAAVKVLS